MAAPKGDAVTLLRKSGLGSRAALDDRVALGARLPPDGPNELLT